MVTQEGLRRVVLYESLDYVREAIIHPSGAVSIRAKLENSFDDCVFITPRDLVTIYTEVKKTQGFDSAAMRAEDI